MLQYYVEIVGDWLLSYSSLKEKAVHLSLLSMMLSVGFFVDVLYKIKVVPPFLSIVRVFIMNG